MEVIQAFDEAAVLFIYENIQTPALDGLMTGITRLGDKGALWIALTLVMLALCIKNKGLRGMALSCALGLILSAIFCNMVIKPAVMRIRPYDLLGLEIMVEALADYSFPSGHTSAAFAFAVAVWSNDRRLGMAALTAALVMAMTRLYLCVHFPTDVVAGAVLGIVCGWIGFKAAAKIFKKETKV